MSIIKAMARSLWEVPATEDMSEETVATIVRAALAAAEKAGYVLVPKEPTEEMADAGKGAAGFLASPEGWRAMLAAAPKVE